MTDEQYITKKEMVDILGVIIDSFIRGNAIDVADLQTKMQKEIDWIICPICGVDYTGQDLSYIRCNMENCKYNRG